ncbi:MAG: hypothetical protein ACWA5U_02345 [bacterium]
MNNKVLRGLFNARLQANDCIRLLIFHSQSGDFDQASSQLLPRL